MAMNIQRVNFDPATGDSSTAAFRKLDLDIGEVAKAIDGDGTAGSGVTNRVTAVEQKLAGLGNAAVRNVGTASGTVAAGDDGRFAANAAAAAAASATAAAALTKLNPTGTGLLKTDAVNPIANTNGDTRIVFDMGVSNGTDDRIQLLCTRVTANNDWQGTIWRLRRLVNGFQQGMIEFGQGQIATGGAVTINGAVPWTTANTTVDGNNFIKRI